MLLRRPALLLGTGAVLVIANALDVAASRSSLTSQISGVVRIAGAGGGPAEDAVVVVRDDTGEPIRQTVTDESGTFLIEGLSDGRYQLTASRAGLVGLPHGATRPWSLGIPVPVATGSAAAEVELLLLRGGVITGTVRNRFNAPMASVQVRAYRRTFQQGRRVWLPLTDVPRVVTNGSGTYRLYGLPPGTYAVAAVAAQGYSSTFHPQTGAAEQARTVTVDAGDAAAGIDIAMLYRSTSKVSGTVVEPGGLPLADVKVWFESVDGSGEGGGAMDAGRQFEIPALPAGQYVIHARARTADASGPGWTHAGRTDFSLAGRDRDDLIVPLQPTTSITGHIESDGAGGPPLPLAGVRLRLVEAGANELYDVPQAVIASDGTFSVRAAPGRYRFQIELPAGWQVRSIGSASHSGDLADIPLEVRGAESSDGLVVTCTRELARYVGTVRDADGSPSSAFTLVLFPSNPDLLVPESRRIRAARPDLAGAFAFDELPAGAYLVAAVADVEAGEWFSREFLESIRARGVPVAIADRGTVRQDLQLPGQRHRATPPAPRRVR